MNTVFKLMLVMALIVTASVGCLVIFEVFTVARGAELLLKSVAVLTLVGVASAAIAAIAAPKTISGE